MIRKYCPHCREYSYSASAANPWYCANCDEDLSREPVLEIDERAPGDCDTQQENCDTRQDSCDPKKDSCDAQKYNCDPAESL